MDLSGYVGKWVKIDTVTNIYFEGRVLFASEDSIEILDKRNQKVSFSSKAILFIREVQK